MMEVVASAFINKTASNGAGGAAPSCHGLQESSNNNNKRAASVSASACSWEPKTGSILDPFHIEDLLDFSNEDIAGPIGEEGGGGVVVGVPGSNMQSQSQQQSQQPCSNNSSSITIDTTNTTTRSPQQQQHQHQQGASSMDHHANEFSIDCDEMPELEWLSSPVDDDSF